MIGAWFDGDDHVALEDVVSVFSDEWLFVDVNAKSVADAVDEFFSDVLLGVVVDGGELFPFLDHAGALFLDVFDEVVCLLFFLCWLSVDADGSGDVGPVVVDSHAEVDDGHAF